MQNSNTQVYKSMIQCDMTVVSSQIQRKPALFSLTSSLSVFSAAVMMNGVLEFPRRFSSLDGDAAWVAHRPTLDSTWASAVTNRRRGGRSDRRFIWLMRVEYLFVPLYCRILATHICIHTTLMYLNIYYH